MTVQDLYAIYLRAYAEASHFHSGALPDAPSLLASRRRPMIPVERTIEELARHDATNGTPVRSRAAFERALADGARALHGMGSGREVAA
jgi:hypothetical protein